MNKEISFIVVNALNNWHKQEEDMKYIQNRTKVLEEELKSLNKERDKINSERYKYTDIAIKEHKYWKNKNNSEILEIINFVNGEFLITNKKLNMARRFSSSLGILWDCNIPIFEDEYNKLKEELTKINN